MKVKDYVSVIRDEVNVNVTYDGRKITEFKAPYWDTIESDILNLEIREVKYPGKSIIVETKTGRPTIVSSAAELEAAVEDESIKFIKLGADIEGSINLSSGQKILDLAGHELTVTEPSGSSVAILVAGDAVLDVFDSEGCGVVRDSDCVVTSENATVKLHSGGFVCGSDATGGSAVFSIDNSKICIYGGYYVNIAYDGVDNVIFGVDPEEGGTITCFGGKYRDQDPADYVADGYQATAIPDTDPVVYQVKSIL